MNTYDPITETDEQLVLPFDPPLEETPAAEPADAIDVEALRAENERLRAAVRLSDAQDPVTAALKAAGAGSPDLLFSAAKASLQFDEDGAVQNIEALVSDLKQKFPEQFGARMLGSIDGGAGNTGNAAPLTKEALSRMSPAEIARLDWNAVREVLAN